MVFQLAKPSFGSHDSRENKDSPPPYKSSPPAAERGRYERPFLYPYWINVIILYSTN